MATLKRGWFSRGVRMTHRFGESTNDDVLGGGTFDPQIPVFPDNCSPSLLRKKLGEYSYDEPLSPVVKPSGVRASMNGPKPDHASEVAAVTPASTRKRKSIK
jgi:hypothetical protein